MARPHRYAKRCGREYWSVGVLRQDRIAPRVRGVGDAFRAVFGLLHPGLKPWATLCEHFMVKNPRLPTNHQLLTAAIRASDLVHLAHRWAADLERTDLILGYKMCKF